MNLTRCIDPLIDPRWSSLVAEHPDATIFHTTGWLQALRKTYGYRPIVYATDVTGSKLRNGIPCCEIHSRMTRPRLVSLPFSDHCDPLLSGADDLHELQEILVRDAQRMRWRSVQLRPKSARLQAVTATEQFSPRPPQWHFAMDLSHELETIQRRIKSDIRKDVRKAERLGARYHVGNELSYWRTYYRLHVLTRGKHGIPPQPWRWFVNLQQFLPDAVEVHLTEREGEVVAGLVTAQFRDQFMWKYSGSLSDHDRDGMSKFLMWKSIERAHGKGARYLDMGRCDPENVGLVTFKERWGGVKSALTYFRYPPWRPSDPRSLPRRVMRAGGAVARAVLARLPASLLATLGDYCYGMFG